MTKTPQPFSPNTNAADAYTVVSDTAPMEFWVDFAEATGLVARVILVRDYLRSGGYHPGLAVLRDTAVMLAGANR